MNEIERQLDDLFSESDKKTHQFMFAVGETQTSFCYDKSLWGLYPGYPINRVTDSPALMPNEGIKEDCTFKLVRNTSNLSLSGATKFSFESCSVFLVGYPKKTEGIISLEIPSGTPFDASQRPSPASECFFRLTIMLQGFDRALFVPKDQLFDDVSNVSPFETLYSSRSRQIPRVFEFLTFYCQGIAQNYYSDKLKSEIDKCIASARKRGVSGDMEIR